ncbi:MAG: DUF488 domain-containing protein [Candidatus Micrarchaeaceae archaeon]
MLKGTKRVYEKPQKEDGLRVLVERLWPRGISKERAKIDIWLKEVAPSNELRKWFGHDPKKWEEFKKRYKEELKGNKSLEELKNLIKEKDVVLIYSASDEEHNNAKVLEEILSGRA